MIDFYKLLNYLLTSSSISHWFLCLSICILLCGSVQFLSLTSLSFIDLSN